MNEHFNITCESWRDMLDDTGDDMVLFDLDVQYTEADEPPFRVSVWFGPLTRYLAEFNPELEQYISKVRSNIGGWGPKETKVVAELHESGVDVIELAIEFAYNCYDMEVRRQHENKLRKEAAKNPQKAQQQHEKVVDLANTLKGHADNMRESTKKDIKLKETLEKRINATVLDLYPIILESDPKYIKQWGSRLTWHVLQIAGDVDKISFAAGKGE